jgi:hypothetical protein
MSSPENSTLDPTRELKTKIMISQTSRLWIKQARVAHRIK